MRSCTFFGHRDCPEAIRTKLQKVLIDLITNHNITMFYVGHQGQFDALVRNLLRQLKSTYPQINYAVVLAYMPTPKKPDKDWSDTMLPEGIEAVHPRYAISWRNNWMLKKADCVVTCIAHTWGGAAQYARKAKAQGKYIVNVR